MGKIVLLALLLCIAGYLGFRPVRREVPEVLRTEELRKDDCAAGIAFVERAAELFSRNRRDFAALWFCNGDVYHNSLELLGNAPLEELKVVRVFRRKAAKDEIKVQVASRGRPALVFSIAPSGRSYRIVSIVGATP